MFKALMGGGSRDGSSSRSSRRKSTADGDDAARSSSRRQQQSKRSSASSVSSSRRSTRGDDRDRGLGDLSASRSVTGESTTTYVTAEPESYVEEPVIIERTPRYVNDNDNGDDRQAANRTSSSRRDSKKKERRDTKDRSTRDDTDSERVRTRSGDNADSSSSRYPPAGTTAGHFADEIAAPGFNQFPMQYDAAIPSPSAQSHSPLDPHIAQQFPGQLSGAGTQPYIPPNPAGLAADYYGDQGQSVSQQPGVRPHPPDVIVGTEPHLMPASPIANPPPEPSSLGQVGAAAEYYAAGDSNTTQYTSTPSKPSKISKPSSKPSKPSKPTSEVATGAGAATYGISSDLINQASSNYPVMSGSLPNPSTQQTTGPVFSQNGMGMALGGAAAGAAAAYMINHHNHQNDTYGIGVPPRPGGFTSNSNTPMQSGPVYTPQSFNGPPPTYSSGGLQSGSLAYHQRHHGPLARFIDFWKDPEGVGKFEDYTEAIGVCKYCFEPGTTSRDAPRKHHYNRRKRSPVVERYGSSTRVDKLTRYASSEDESRRNKSKSGSWLAGGIAGYVAKSLFSNKGFDDTYSVRSGHRVSSRQSNYEEGSAVSSGKASSTSRGVLASRDSKVYTTRDSKTYKVSRRSSRSRSRSRSRDHRGIKEAAIGAAVGSVLTAAASRSSRHRSTSRNRSSSRERSSRRHTRRRSDSSERLHVETTRGRRRSSPKSFKSFFSAPSANRRKKHSSKRRGFFSFGNSSSSSGDYDLAFGGSELFGSSVSGRSSKSSRSSKKQSRSNVDAEILGLGLAARQLAHASSRKDIHPRDLARPSSHSRPLGPDDDDWEDADSSDSALSTNLAYGGSELFGSQESVGGSSFWPWRSSRKDKRRQSQQEFVPTVSDQYAPSPAGFGNYNSSSGINTLQQVYPVPTSDPSRFDAVRMSTSSSPNVQPPLVRPGPIPLQQPQPITPVSQSVYYPSQTGPILPGTSSQYISRSEDVPSRVTPHRRNSSPVMPTAPLDGTPSPGILKRRSTTKDPAAVSFAFTEEQADRQEKVDRRERERLSRKREEARVRDKAEEEERKERKREERRRREELEAEEAREARRRKRREEAQDDRQSEDRSSPSWAVPVVATIGAAAVASVVAEKVAEDKQSASRRSRYEERAEKRRSERRRASGSQEEVTEVSYHEEQPHIDEEYEKKRKEERIAKKAASRIVRSASPAYESYVDFFKPEDLQNSESSHDVTAIERQNASDSDTSVIPPVRINIIAPTPPASHEGSVRDVHSPIPAPEPTIEEKPEEEEATEVVREVEQDRPTTVSRVSWGEHRTHEYEVETPLSEKDEPEPISDHYDEVSLKRDVVKEPIEDTFAEDRARQDQTSRSVEKRSMPGGFEDDSEFAATLAAGAEMAGFDPSLVTNDASYYRRDSPPGSELKGTYRSPMVESVEDLGEQGASEVKAERNLPDVIESIEPEETIAAERIDSSYRNKSFKEETKDKRSYDQNADIEGAEDIDFGDTSRSVASTSVKDDRKKSKKSEKSSKARDDFDTEPAERSKPTPSTTEISGASQRDDETLDRDGENYNNDSNKVREIRPVDGWEEDVSERRRRKSKRSSKDRSDSLDDARSVAASAPGADELEKYRTRRSKRDEEDFEDDSRSLPDMEDDGEKRRRRRKRHSGAFDDTASVVSSPANIDETREKRRSRESSLAKEKDKEQGQGKKSGGLFSNLFGSKSTVERSSSADKRDVRSEAGVDEYSKAERRRKKRSSGGAYSEASHSVLDLSRLDKGKEGEEEEDEDDSQSSRRRRREQKRRNKYEGIVESARDTSEKERYIPPDDADEDNDKRKSFLGTRPEMPPMTTSSEGLDIQLESGASGLPFTEGLDSYQNDLSDKFQQMQRYRSRSVSPSSSEKVLDMQPKSHSRPSSPSLGQEMETKPRRLSMLRTIDSPTAVPLHFRRPPTSPNGSRRVSMSSPAQSPSSPKPGHRRPTSIEFKNAREIRPLWLVERHSSGKFDDEPEGPLPSLPSSKTTSRSPSVEDLRQASDIATFTDSLIHHDGPPYSWGRRPTDLRISTDQLPHDEGDYLNSQQATPTAETYRQSFPPPIKKEKPKYEFHSPSELLQDPATFHPEVPELPPSLDPLPSVAGSVVSDKEANTTHGETSRDIVTSPHEPESAKHRPTSKDKSSGVSSFLAGAGLASVVDAAVSKAVESHGKSEEWGEKSEPHVATDRELPHSEDVVGAPRDILSDKSHKDIAPSAAGKGGFGAIVDAAVAAAVEDPAYTHFDDVKRDSSEKKFDLPEQSLLKQSDDISATEPKLVADEAKDITFDDPAPTISKKQKRKDKKKKQKSKDIDNAPLDDDESKPSTSATVEPTEAERAEPAEASTEVPEEQFTSKITEPTPAPSDQPSPVDASRDIDESELRDLPTAEIDQPEAGIPQPENEAPPSSKVEQGDGDANDQPTHVPAEPEDFTQSTSKSQKKKKKNKKKAQSLPESLSLEEPQAPVDEPIASATTDEPKTLEIQTQDPSSPIESPGPTIAMDEPKAPGAQPDAQTPIDASASTQQTDENWEDGFTTMSKSQKKKNKKKQKNKSLSLNEEPGDIFRPVEPEVERSEIQPAGDEKGDDAFAAEQIAQQVETRDTSDEQPISDSALHTSDQSKPEASAEDVLDEANTAPAVEEEFLVTSDAPPEITGEDQSVRQLEIETLTHEPQDITETTLALQSEEKSDEPPVDTSSKQSKSKKKKKKRQSLALDDDFGKATTESPETNPPQSDVADTTPIVTENDKSISEQLGKAESSDFAELDQRNDQPLQPATDISDPAPGPESITDTKEAADYTAFETEPTGTEQAAKLDESSEPVPSPSDVHKSTEIEEATKPEDYSETKDISTEVQKSTEQPAEDDIQWDVTKKSKKKKNKKKSVSIPWEDETGKAGESVQDPEFSKAQSDKSDELTTTTDDTTPFEAPESGERDVSLETEEKEAPEPSPATNDADLVSQAEAKPESEPEQPQTSTSKSKKKKGKKGKRVSWIDETSFQPPEEPEDSMTTEPAPPADNESSAPVEVEPSALSESQPPSLSEDTEQSSLAKGELSEFNEADAEASSTKAEPSSLTEEENPTLSETVSSADVTEAETTTFVEAEVPSSLEAEPSLPVEHDQSTPTETEKSFSTADVQDATTPETEFSTEVSEDISEAKPEQDLNDQQEIQEQVANEPPASFEQNEQKNLVAPEDEDWNQADSKNKRKKDKKKEKKRKKALESLALEEESSPSPAKEDGPSFEPSEAPIPKNTDKDEPVETQPAVDIDQQPETITEERAESQDLDALSKQEQPADNTAEVDDEWMQGTKSKKKKDKKKKRKSLQVEAAQEEDIGDTPKDSAGIGEGFDSEVNRLDTSLEETKNDLSQSLEDESRRIQPENETQESDVKAEDTNDIAINEKDKKESFPSDAEPTAELPLIQGTNEEAADPVQSTEVADIGSTKDAGDEPQELAGKSKKKSKKNKKEREPYPWDKSEPEPVAEEQGDPDTALSTAQQAAGDDDDKAADATHSDFDLTPESTVRTESQKTVESPENDIDEVAEVLESNDTTPMEREKLLSAKEKRKEKKKKRRTVDLSNEEPTATSDVPDTQGLLDQEDENVEKIKDEIPSVDSSADGFSVAGKKKGKKKKRQSVNWEEDIIEAAGGEASNEGAKEIAEKADDAEELKESASQESPSGEDAVPKPVPEDPETTLQETPVEVDGKETFQSSDKIDTDTKEKDFGWTDNMVSSQVQSQTEDYPYPVPSPTLVDRENVFQPDPTEKESQSREAEVVVGSSLETVDKEGEDPREISAVDIGPSIQEAENDPWTVSSDKSGKGKNKKKKKQKSISDEVRNDGDEITTQTPVDLGVEMDVLKSDQNTFVLPDQNVKVMAEDQTVIEQDTPMINETESSEEKKDGEDKLPVSEGENVGEEVEFETPVPVETVSRKLSKKEKKKQKKKGKIATDFDEDETTAATKEIIASERAEDTDITPSIDTPIPAMEEEPTIREPADAVLDTAQEEPQIAELVEEPASTEQPLGRKLSKKEKRKNAKKGVTEIKDEEKEHDDRSREQSTHFAAEENVTEEPRDAAPTEAPSADVTAIPTHVSLDPFEVPDASDEVVDEPKEPLADFDMDFDAKDNQDRDQGLDAQEFLRRKALEKEDDLAIAADLFGEPSNLQKSSEKQKKKKKGKTASSKETERAVETDEIRGYEDDPSKAETKPVTTSINDEALMRRDSKSSKAKGKKKKKKQESSVALEQDEGPSRRLHATSPPTEEQFAADEEQQDIPPNPADTAENSMQSWPSIEFDKERTVIASDLSAKSPPSDNSASLPRHDQDMAEQSQIQEQEPENVVDEFVQTMPAAVPQLEEPPLDDAWSIPATKKGKKKKGRKQFDYEEVPSQNDAQESAPSTELDEATSDVKAASREDVDPQPLSEQAITKPARDLTGDDHPTSSQEMDVDVVSKMAMVAAGLDLPREAAESEPKADNMRMEKPKGRKLKDLTSIYEPKEKQTESQHYKGEVSGPDPLISTKGSTTNKISNIFPGLERATYRRTSPKPAIKQTSDAISGAEQDRALPDSNFLNESFKTSEETSPKYSRSVEYGDVPEQGHPVETPVNASRRQKRPIPSSQQTPVQESTRSPLESTSKDRSSSLLFNSSPSTRFDPPIEAGLRSNIPQTLSHQASSGSLHRTKSIHGHHSGAPQSWKLDDELTPSKQSPRPLHADQVDFSPPRTPLDPIKEHDAPQAKSPRLVMGEERYNLPRPDSRSSVRSSRSLRRANRSISSELQAAATGPDEHKDSADAQKHQKRNGGSGAGWAADSATARPQPPELAEQQTDHFLDGQHIEDISSSSIYDPVTDKGKRPLRGMSDVYEAWGETPNSPRSPTRPPSVRRRQSMQHISELESRLDQLISENRLLAAAKEEAEQKLSRAGIARRKSDQALNSSNADLRDKEAEIARLNSSLEWMQGEVQRLTQENEALNATHSELTASHAREVDNLRTRQVQLATGMETIVRDQISAALAEKDAEIRRLRDELAAARQTVQELQQQIVATTADDVLSTRDEDYFDNACQRLCQHVQQWVLRFSKHSDLRRCRPLAEVRDSNVADRFENAVLDGSDVDGILADRVRRRDVFMAVVMAMIWEYIFARYLFGMDREQRQKLKALEKQLSEVGPRPAVAHWRALTLTLLAKRPSFAQQRERDTEAVALEIMGTLSQLLPPPQNAESQLRDSLHGVLRRAGNLSIEMRTQRAEYMMLPPLQPEYDTQGDLARQVIFNASLMNERSGAYNSNEPLEAQGAIVRLVLFPLVVKKGNDNGEGDDEIVVCPAQVLVARPEGDKTRERDRMSTIGNRSVSSVVPSINMENMI